MKHKKWASGLILGILATCLTACEGGGGAMCPVPPPGTQVSELTLEEVHDFGRNYQVHELEYKLDDCALFRSRDTAVLRKEKVELGTFKVPAGPHELKILTRFESDFGADMHDYDWWSTQGLQVTLPENGRVKGTVRMYEEAADDPRKRMRTAFDFQPVTLEPTPDSATATQ